MLLFVVECKIRLILRFLTSNIYQDIPRTGENKQIILLVSAAHKRRLPIVAESLRSWTKLIGTEENLASICTTLATRRDLRIPRLSGYTKCRSSPERS